MNVVLVFIGGGLGAACRWIIGQSFETRGDLDFPWSTLTVNLIGCFLIGILGYYASKGNSNLYLLGVVGFLGGFTTFSSYGYELVKMLETGLNKNFITYFLTSNILGILLVYIGYKLTSNYLN